MKSDASDALYVVERGRVVVSKHVHNDVDVVLTRFHPGDFFGEMGLFDAAAPFRNGAGRARNLALDV